MIEQKNRELTETLYKQILFYTENGKSTIDSPNFLVQETHKTSGYSRTEVIHYFDKFIEIGFLENINDKTAFRINEFLTLDEILIKIQE